MYILIPKINTGILIIISKTYRNDKTGKCSTVHTKAWYAANE